MPVTSRHQAKKSEEGRDKATDRPATPKAKNGSLPEQDWESISDGDLNKCLHRITIILQSYDGKNILSQSQSSDISLYQILSKINAREYSDIADYQHDIQELFRNSYKASDNQINETLSTLYKMVEQLIRIERARINRVEMDGMNGTKPVNNSSQIAEDDVTMEEANEENAVKVNGKMPKVTPSAEQVQKALYQVTPDGYVFSDMSSIPHWVGGKGDTQELPTNYHEVIIHPVTTTEKDIASLKQAVPNHIEMHRRSDRYEQRMVPVEMLDFGAFASFAPNYDSNSANISFESTYLAKITKQAEREAEKRRTQELYGDSAIDTTWLKNQGFDAEAILESVNGLESKESEEKKDMSSVIEQNAHLLKRLADLQDERFNQPNPANKPVGKEELRIANILQQRLQEAAGQVTPSDLVNADAIENAMQRMPAKHAIYRGTLPPTKLFAFPAGDSGGMPQTGSQHNIGPR